MQEETIPLEAGIEDRAISLTKGCYVGQEIIIRILHRGHGRVARKLVGLSFAEGTGVPEAGAVITSGTREIGSVTSAADSPALGRPVALGYVHRDFVEPGTSVAVAGVPAHVAALPFVPVTPLV
jgi:folate-binding protein YgfZ